MYTADGLIYNEEHSISFGDLVTKTSQGVSYEDFSTIANTWTDWHLIPSSVQSIAHPTFVTKFVEIPGADGMLDLTEYLTGKPVYGQRQGSFSFYIAHGFQSNESLRENIASVLHGKRLKMRLMDDPMYYYDGRYTVGTLDYGKEIGSITISYQLEPFKKSISAAGSSPLLWDPFNFETDYDYSVVMYPAIVADGTTKTYYIYAGDQPVSPVATWVSGSVTLIFGGVTKTITSGSETLGASSKGRNTLRVSGNGSVKLEWRGVSL